MIKILVLLIFFGQISYAQDGDKTSLWNYTLSNTSLHVNSNYDSRFSNEGESSVQKGLSFEINSLYGVFLLKYISLSGGIGVDFNINRTYWALPALADLRVYTKRFGQDGSLYGLLQFGKNIEIKKVFREGRIVKIGAGIVIDNDINSDLIVELYAKYKETFFPESTQLYNISAVGFSIGYKY